MFTKIIAWLKSQFTKGKSEMTEVVQAVETAVEAIVPAVEQVVAPAPAVVDAFEDAAAKIKAVYDKLGIDVHAWDQVKALAKAL
ncbi:hypothetical protein [Neorhizobium sp. P12A]|uniref:hypothetical protein n=1 Tax=Neorhizobium sp. P12A TaxID=2268027 RepID=UPI0011EC5EF1|nr:hypothetical protein [Neorhizobium sp. P12A]